MTLAAIAIVSAVVFGWAAHASRAHRALARAFDECTHREVAGLRLTGYDVAGLASGALYDADRPWRSVSAGNAPSAHAGQPIIR